MAGSFVQVAGFVWCMNDMFHGQPCPQTYSREIELSDAPFCDYVLTGMATRTGFALSHPDPFHLHGPTVFERDPHAPL